MKSETILLIMISAMALGMAVVAVIGLAAYDDSQKQSPPSKPSPHPSVEVRG